MLALETERINIQMSREFPARGKESTGNAGDVRDVGSIPGLGRCPEGRQGNTL